MLRLKENIGSLSGIQAVALSNPIYEWPLGEFSPDGTYESYTSEDGDEEIMEVMGYKLLKGLPWKEAIERYPHPVYLNDASHLPEHASTFATQSWWRQGAEHAASAVK